MFETEVDASGPVVLIVERFGLKKNLSHSTLCLSIIIQILHTGLPIFCVGLVGRLSQYIITIYSSLVIICSILMTAHACYNALI